MRVIISSGGAELANRTAQIVQDAGYLKSFITTRMNGSLGKKLDPGLVTRIRLPTLLGQVVRKLPFLRKRISWNLLKDSLFDQLASRHVEGCDIFHAWSGYGLYSQRVAGRHGAKVVVTLTSAHPRVQAQLLEDEYRRAGLRLPSGSRQFVEKQEREYEEADFIMVPTRFVYESMAQSGVHETKLLQVELGVDGELFQPGPKLDETFRVLFVGQAGFRKGILYLLEAMKELDFPDAELLIVGGIQDGFGKILGRYNGSFRYQRPVPQQFLPELYRSCSVLVVPSIEDGIPTVALEGMACGRPVIVTENAGARDFITDGETGYVVPVRDVEALKEKILFLRENGSEGRMMGTAARERVSSMTWDRYGRAVLGAYRYVLSGSKST